MTTTSHHADNAADTDPSRYVRAKQWLLRLLIVSLAACALVAVLVLLFGSFNETTARILLTLGALALHSGVAMACAASLERRLWTVLSAVGLAAFAVNFVVVVACIWWPGGLDLPMLRAMLTTGALLAAYVLAIPSGDLFERRRHPPLAITALVACAAALALTVICIWAPASEHLAFARATGTVAVLAFTLAQLSFLVRIPGFPSLRWVFVGTIACAWAVASMATTAIWREPTAELFYRIFGALGVLDATGSLTLVILAVLQRMTGGPGPAGDDAGGPADAGGHAGTPGHTDAGATVELRCPRCTTLQTLSAGRSACSACGLKFRIEIEPPRCAQCGHSLWQQPDRRCPECGATF